MPAGADVGPTRRARSSCVIRCRRPQRRRPAAAGPAAAAAGQSAQPGTAGGPRIGFPAFLVVMTCPASRPLVTSCNAIAPVHHSMVLAPRAAARADLAGGLARVPPVAGSHRLAPSSLRVGQWLGRWAYWFCNLPSFLAADPASRPRRWIAPHQQHGDTWALTYDCKLQC